MSGRRIIVCSVCKKEGENKKQGVCVSCYNKNYMKNVWYKKPENLLKTRKLQKEYAHQNCSFFETRLGKDICPICSKPAYRINREYRNKKTGHKSINSQIYRHQNYMGRDKRNRKIYKIWYHIIPLREA